LILLVDERQLEQAYLQVEGVLDGSSRRTSTSGSNVIAGSPMRNSDAGPCTVY